MLHPTRKLGVWHLLTVGTALLLGPALGLANTITLTLSPNGGSISGPPGSTIGWGYTITNNSPYWIQTLKISAGVFLHGTPKAIFDFPAVAPGSAVTLDFSLVAGGGCASPPCGLYELTWDATAPLGFTNMGTFKLSSDFYSARPGTPGAKDLGHAPSATAPYSAAVSCVSASAQPCLAPEPRSLFLLAAGLAVLAVRLGVGQRKLRRNLKKQARV